MRAAFVEFLEQVSQESKRIAVDTVAKRETGNTTAGLESVGVLL